VQSCCCGWQTLEHGLFIFAVFDIFWNLVMVCFSILVSNAGIAGLNGLLILTDVGLAFGAKQGVSTARYTYKPFKLGGARVVSFDPSNKLEARQVFLYKYII
jgi:hypothetical protein